MSETGSSSLGSNSEIDDPGRDPKGLGGRRATRSAAGRTRTAAAASPRAAPGTEGESMMPESPTDDDDRV